MWKISKQFDFCYGHRVWSQNLNSEYSIDSCLMCRHIHGHQGTIMVYLEADELKDGMVTDFKHLNWFKKWLDDTLDHKFIMDINDPLFNQFIPVSEDFDGDDNPPIIWGQNGYGIIDLSQYPKKQLENGMNEFLEGMVFVTFIPTSENLSKWIFDIVQEKMKPLGVRVSGVQFYETPKSQSNYFAH